MRCNQSDCLNGIMVQGEGETSGTMFIGEAPGSTEMLLSRTFVGQAGQFLRERVKGPSYFTNAVKCRPPENRRPKKKEINYCWERWLDNEIAQVKPEQIVCLGKTAAVSLGIMGPNENLKDYLDCEYEYQGIPVKVTYHPSYAKRFGKTIDL